MAPAGKPNAFALQSVPEKTCCSCCSLALLRFFRSPVFAVMKTMGAAPTAVTVIAGTVVLVMGSLPVMLNARTFALAVEAGKPLAIGVPTPFDCAVAAAKIGHTPAALFVL